MDQFNDSSFNTFELQINQVSKDNLRAAAGWGLFISILGFIFTAILLLFSLLVFAGNNTQNINIEVSTSIVALLMLFFAVVWFIPTFFLFRFSVKIRNAINDMSTQELNDAFSSLKINLATAAIGIVVSVLTYLGFTIYVVSKAFNNIKHFN